MLVMFSWSAWALFWNHLNKKMGYVNRFFNNSCCLSFHPISTSKWFYLLTFYPTEFFISQSNYKSLRLQGKLINYLAIITQFKKSCSVVRCETFKSSKLLNVQYAFIQTSEYLHFARLSRLTTFQSISWPELMFPNSRCLTFDEWRPCETVESFQLA